MQDGVFVQLNVRVPPELDRRLEHVAASTDVKKTALIIACLEDGLRAAEEGLKR